jgi:hypothetical protein
MMYPVLAKSAKRPARRAYEEPPESDSDCKQKDGLLVVSALHSDDF